VAIDLYRLAFGLPLPALVSVLADQFALPGADTHHWITDVQEPRRQHGDVPELGITLGMIRAFLGLEHRLQPEPGPLQQPDHHGLTDLKSPTPQRLYQ
jgi:hypothetical protein